MIGIKWDELLEVVIVPAVVLDDLVFFLSFNEEEPLDTDGSCIECGKWFRKASGNRNPFNKLAAAATFIISECAGGGGIDDPGWREECGWGT